MGKYLGSYASDELDRPDLNKCPDCNCYFEADYCPLCGKLCPEEMRAGNRKKVKKKKRSHGDGGRVIFISWYHSWWFIILSFFVFSPIVALILLLTSPHKKGFKIAAIAITVAWLVVLPIALSLLTPFFNNLLDTGHVDASLTKEEYILACAEVDPEDFYRNPEEYDGKYVKMTLVVEGSFSTSTSVNLDGSAVRKAYLFCSSPDNSSITLTIRDCSLDGAKNYIKGDIITVYGEGSGNAADGSTLNAAYIQLIEPIE